MLGEEVLALIPFSTFPFLWSHDGLEQGSCVKGGPKRRWACEGMSGCKGIRVEAVEGEMRAA